MTESQKTFQQEWTLETALEIVAHPTVDSQIWAEAIEWLLIYGPPPLREMLQAASGHATSSQFPDLKPERYAPDGSPCYDIAELAQVLDIAEEEARVQLMEKEMKHGVQHGFGEDDTTSLQ